MDSILAAAAVGTRKKTRVFCHLKNCYRRVREKHRIRNTQVGDQAETRVQMPIATAASRPEATAPCLSKVEDTAPLAFQRHLGQAQKLGTTCETPPKPPSPLADLDPDSMVPYPDVLSSARRQKVPSPILLSRSPPSIRRRDTIPKSA